MRAVAVLCGGPSLEHEISLQSGHEVVEHIDPSRYQAVEVIIGRDGRWKIGPEEPRPAPEAALTLLRREIDTCFVALHGPFGEDGRVQAFLETCGIRYTGSGPRACAATGDKIIAKRLAASIGIRCAADLESPPSSASDVIREIGTPCVVKDPHQGSTLGMEIVEDGSKLAASMDRLGANCERLLIEECVSGREFTVSVLDLPGEQPRALPLTEILADGYFDFTKKYSETHGAEEVCPADIHGPPADTMRDWALVAHRTFGLRGLSRTDFLLPEDGIPVFLETNAIPGMTSRSLFPQACAAAGISFGELITMLLEAAHA